MITKCKSSDKIEVSFDEEDIDRDCWCMGKLYSKLGLVEEFERYKDSASINKIKCNEYTENIIRNKIRENYCMVTLTYYPEIKVKRYRKTKKKLTPSEELDLSMDLLNFLPAVDNKVKDMVIRFEIN